MKLISAHLLIVTLLVGLPLFAASQSLSNPIPRVGDLPALIAMLINIFMFIASPILVVMLIYSGYLFVSAQGNGDQIAEARTILLWTIIGGAIVAGAKILAVIVANTMSAVTS